MGLDALCAVPESRKTVERFCVTQEHLTSLRLISILTLIFGLVLLIAISWAGRQCRRDRELLIRLFRTGTHLSTSATLLLVLAMGFLSVTTLYYGTAEFLSRIPFGLIFLMGLGALLAVYQILRLLFAFNKEICSEVDGRLLSAAHAPELWAFVNRTSAAVGTAPPQQILAGTEPTFFVTETKVKTDESEATGRTLYLSIPLCQILTTSELRSIVGHEMAHFHGKDTEFSRNFYPIFRKGSDTLEAVAGTARSVGAGGYALLPAIWILSFYLESFAAVEAEISRERELAADVIGAAITSKRDLAMALMKVVQHDGAWEQVYAEMIESGAAGREGLQTPSELFRRLVEQRRRTTDRSEEIKRIESQQLFHPTDSHPPLCDRLRALGFTVEELYDDSAEIWPSEPSSSMIPDANILERELIPAFAPKSEEAQTIFKHRQAGFAAMEYYALIMNRSFLVFLRDEGLYGIKFRGLVSSNEGRYFDSVLNLLDDPWFFPGTPAFTKAMKDSRANFFISMSDILEIEFDGSAKWGMGQIPHAGKLRLRLSKGTTREFVLLGDAYGDGIRRMITERIARH